MFTGSRVLRIQEKIVDKRKEVKDQVMKYTSTVLVVIATFFNHLGLCERFQDFIPIKFDVLKVRSESEMKEYRGYHAALDFVS